jgi:hypothetical protein
MTPAQVRAAVLAALGEPDAIFHTNEQVMRHTRAGEQLIGMARALTEKTGVIPLTYNQPLYQVHNYLPDFIFPLHITILKRQLYPTTLSQIVSTDPYWLRAVGEPKKYFMVGANQLGVYPTAPSNGQTLSITYIAVPNIPTDRESFLIDRQWHEALISYATAMLLAKEQKYQEATQQLQDFMKKIRMKRDGRFSPEVKGERAEEPVHPQAEASVG